MTVGGGTRFRGALALPFWTIPSARSGLGWVGLPGLPSWWSSLVGWLLWCVVVGSSHGTVCEMGVVLNSPFESLLRGLDPEQREAVSAPPSPLVVVAGAGSGKTTVLTRRIALQVARGDAPAANVLAVSHTTKAAGTIKSRLTQVHPSLGAVSSMTVHAAAWRILRQFHAAAGFATQPELVSSTFMLVRDGVRSVGGSTKDSAVLADLATELEWMAANNLSASDYVAAARQHRREPPLPLGDVASLASAVSELKRERNLVDFGDLLSISTHLLGSNPDVASRVRSKWSLLLVDEFQDTDHAQARFLSELRGSSPLWTVVGDPRQTIYSFKGADPSLLQSQMRAPGVKVVYLSNSWRCSKEILEWSNQVIGSKYGPPLNSQSSGPVPSFIDSKNEEDEASQVVRQLRTWVSQGVSFDKQAVLFRFNGTSARVEAMLAAENIPFQLLGGVPFFERPEVRAVLARFMSEAESDPDADGLGLLRSVASALGFDLDDPPTSQGQVRQRWESVRALSDLVSSGSASECAGLFEELASAQTEPGGVSLGTIHAAKGLEWDAVVVYGLSEGSLPSHRAVGPAAIEEERRLLYVAMTRARSRLALAYTRTFKRMPQLPSKFLFDLPSVASRFSSSRTRSASLSASRSSKRFPGSTGRGVSGSRPGRSSGYSGSSSSSSLPKSSPSADFSLPRCSKCGGKLSGDVARSVGRCGPECLDWADLARFEAALAWCSTPGWALPPRLACRRPSLRACSARSRR